MYCFNCKTKIDLIQKKVAFRAVCERCDADIHICKNCRHYFLGKPNDCLVPNTEYVLDREKNNFCEDFSPIDSLDEPKVTKEEIAKKLFKEEESSTSSSIDSLFKNSL